MKGTFRSNLLRITKSWPEVQQTQAFVPKYVYQEVEKLTAEIAGYEIIQGLLSIYRNANRLLEWSVSDLEAESLDSHSRRVVVTLPFANEVPNNRYEWLFRVLDAISFMTDSAALQLYKKMSTS